MLIGKLASKSGFSRDTIRYYEKLGLICADSSNRHENNYKNYPPKALDNLAQIAQLKTLGFTLSEIAELLETFESSSLPCVGLPEKLHSKIALFDKKIALLKGYKKKLQVVEKACNGACGDEGILPECFSAVGGMC